MDTLNFENINAMLDQDVDLREKIKEQVADLDKKSRNMVGLLNKVHSTRPEAIPALLNDVRQVLSSCHSTTRALADLVPHNQFWRWKDMWTNSLRNAVFAASLVEYLSSRTLIPLPKVAETLGIEGEWEDRLSVPVEDYLHGLISLVNELSRLAVNAVTLGNFEEPIRISVFVKELFVGFSMLNLKNDLLRRRFDSLKYDIKKIEEELDCWSQAAASLSTLTAQFSRHSTLETIERVNRLISAWPVDDNIPAEGLDGVKATHKKLAPALRDIQNTADEELKSLDDAIERVGVLIALRKAPLDTSLPDKRPKRRVTSPSATPVPGATSRNSVSITLPARTSVGPGTSGFSRDPKSRREALHKQLPLQEGRRVAFHPPPGKTANGTTDNDENTWILALVTKCINADKNRYEVQDAEPQEDGTGVLYNTTLRMIIPLPDPGASPGHPAHISSYQTFPAGATVLALYPDTSCFYRAEVIAAPKDMHPKGNPPAKYMPTYKLKFEDDDNQEHTVAAQWVVEWPGTS
ncbi:hypothetical protein C0992_012602 [Termitomyces sp. T32_za158]|nr:hypothetical protein C0992_012602 [Termitomyces sp. T32_za158]